ncbi:TonB-dependent receptor [Hymenobacter sp. BT188]|uniref:TonB-dependent receptor plug domain-containing protein n=1 Tax=Hymenobacter sp. BT188 TaxID=2763504 RepID=UPI0016512639|nr:TonB-dependent receptor [Hymenobacter sp. BT188]MBC6608761.1 TonB-dependent receptor [Hymenobacter sp. BT188]
MFNLRRPLTGLLVTACLTASAQQAVPDSARAIRLQDVIISARRGAESRVTVPQQVDVLSAPTIRQLNPPTTADALQQSGWVYVQKSQLGGGSPVLRGFEANKVLLVVDGVRLNNAIFRGGHLQNVLGIDANVLERVEILSGAGAVPYGSDALGGVISLYTKQPQLADSSARAPRVGAAGLLRYATAAREKTLHADLSLGWRRVAWLTSVTATDFDDLRKGRRDYASFPGFGEKRFYVRRLGQRDSVLVNPDPNRQRDSGYGQLDVLQKLLFRPTPQQQHLLNLQYSTTTAVPRYDRLLVVQTNGLPRYAEWNYGPQRRLLASYQYQYHHPTRFFDALHFTPALQLLAESRLVRDFGQERRQENREQVRVWSANLDLQKTLGRHELRYGAEGTHNRVHSTGTARNVRTGQRQAIVTRYPNGATYATTGLYATHRWSLSPVFSLSTGLRVSTVCLRGEFDPRFFQTDVRQIRQSSASLDGSLGLVAQLPGGFRASGLLGTAFRNPNVDDAGKTFEQNNGTLLLPNPDLRPERVRTAELELSQRIENKLHVALTSFYTQLRDALTVQPYTTPSGATTVEFNGATYATVASTNTGRARIYGLSARAQAEVGGGWSAQGSLTYTQGRDRTRRVPLDHIPPLYGRAGIGYRRRALTAEASVLFNGRKRPSEFSPSGEDNLEQATPAGALGWYTGNVRAEYRLTPRWTAQAAVENLLNQSYRQFASGISAPGRNVVLALRFTH